MPYLSRGNIEIQEETKKALDSYRNLGVSWNEFMEGVVRLIRKEVYKNDKE